MNYFNYFTEIEDTFVRRRGKHLHLSPMDWALIESWKETGVPLHIALVGLVDERKGAPLMARITGIRRQLSRELGFVVPLVRVRDELTD